MSLAAVTVLVVLAGLAVLPWTLTRRRIPARTAEQPARRRPVDVDVAVLLDLADAALTAGSSVPGTLAALGRAVDPAAGEPSAGEPAAGRHETATALVRAGRALLLGATWPEAWLGAPAALAPLRDALEPAWGDGAAPGPLLRQAAAGVRARRSREAHEAAARLGVRLVLPLGLCYLPAFVLVGVVPVILGAGWLLLGG